MPTQNANAEFPVSFNGNTATVHLPPRISILEAVAFKQTCHQLAEREPTPQKIVLDCSQTTFIDSSGIGALVYNIKTTRQKKISLVLCQVQPQVMAVLSMTDLLQRVTIEEMPDCQPNYQPNYQQNYQQNYQPNYQQNYQPNSQKSGRQVIPTLDKEQIASLPTTHPSVKSKVKRLIDIVGAIVGLGITGALFIPIAVAIKLNSPGPIFFGQIRCGWMHRPFRMWKFRSMYIDAEARKSEVKNEIEGAKLFKNENDPRITKVGRFLRRTSLDELPQFWNVLKGEMSLVGTRPPTPDEVERYEIPEWQRLDVKPGMTGEWQVNGRSSIKNFEDVVQLDRQYQKNWNLLYDIKLILKTIWVIFHKNSGAL
jgi:anti-anti-sigma factor